jgi:hypothetical protein
MLELKLELGMLELKLELGMFILEPELWVLKLKFESVFCEHVTVLFGSPFTSVYTGTLSFLEETASSLGSGFSILHIKIFCLLPVTVSDLSLPLSTTVF